MAGAWWPWIRRGRGGHQLQLQLLMFAIWWLCRICSVQPLGSMNSMAASYGQNGQTLCSLSAEKANVVTCFGSDVASVYGAPPRLPLVGLTGGDGFVCGLSMGVRQPYCWGNNIYVEAGVPAVGEKHYAALSAGDNHLCALRQSGSFTAGGGVPAAVDCWGYNMTGSFVAAPLVSITSGSFFSCGLFAANFTPVCWGDETGSGAISGAPRALAFTTITAGGYHVCGILQADQRTFCWGRSLDDQVGVPKDTIFTSLVAGKFATCGLLHESHLPLCWDLTLPNRPMPTDVAFATLVAGDYFICGAPVVASLPPLCWGSGYPVTLPTGIAPGMCSSIPCMPGTYSLSANAVRELAASGVTLCPDPSDNVCVNCTMGSCPAGTIESAPCSPTADRQCSADCSHCDHRNSSCLSACTTKSARAESIQIPIIIGELVTAVVVIGVLLMVAFFCVRRKRAKADYQKTNVKYSSSKTPSKSPHDPIRKAKTPATHQDVVDPMASLETAKVRARCFTYSELEDATNGFAEGSELGRGSFSRVYKGILRDGILVAVKRPAVPSTSPTTQRGQSYDLQDFTNEIDLLSRLNHAHLLNLLGYCNENGQRLLVYEYMENGTLFEHLHNRGMSDQLSWITRVKIAVQAARGLEYLHGYACPPVIHRDIKSANILLDDDFNARVADFGLSLLGPSDAAAPLSELPAGTLGYLDPEYYRLHYLTTKSDVYSFGVLLVEILTGRLAVDEDDDDDDSNLVDWAVPLIKKGEIVPILDPRLAHPPDPEGLLRIARVAARCVRTRGKDRPSMDRVTTSLERSLALLMGTPSDGQLILPSEVVLGSNRMHPKSSRSKSSHSPLSSALTADSSWQGALDQPEHQSIASSRIQRRWPSDSDDDDDDDDDQAGASSSLMLDHATPAPPHPGTSSLNAAAHHVNAAAEAKSAAAPARKGSEIAPASPQPGRGAS